MNEEDRIPPLTPTEIKKLREQQQQYDRMTYAGRLAWKITLFLAAFLVGAVTFADQLQDFVSRWHSVHQ